MVDDDMLMGFALDQARQALERGEFPVGCVFAWQGRVIASGARCNSTGRANELDHAEIVALRRFLAGGQQIDPAEVRVYSTMEPCLMCFATLLVNGFRQFVYSYEDAMGGGTNLPLARLAPLYRDLAVSVTGGVRRGESLALFQSFFGQPGNLYLQGSLLAEYTLRQEPASSGATATSTPQPPCPPRQEP
jgi:tRNA(adenine34) deaminase